MQVQVNNENNPSPGSILNKKIIQIYYKKINNKSGCMEGCRGYLIASFPVWSSSNLLCVFWG